MAKLGGALLSTIPDPVISAANLRYNGMNLAAAWTETLSQVLKGRGKGEARELAFLIGEGFDGLAGRIISPYVAGDGAPGLIHRGLLGFFRMSGLAGQADVMRAANARMLSAWLGRNAATAFAALPDRLRFTLALHGIDEAKWDAIRAGGTQTIGGKPYLVPDAIARLGDDVIDELIDPDLVELGESGRRPRRPSSAPAPRDFAVEGIPRAAWPADFPDVFVHRPSGAIGAAIKRHADWPAAKAGDEAAAMRLARDLMKPEVVARIAERLGGRKPSVVAVHADEPGRNRIPLAYADELAHRLGLEVDDDIVQTVAGRTALGRDGRLVQRAAFDGAVEPGRDYLIVDDHATMAGTLADLRAYIENHGGRVILASTLSANSASARLAPGADVLAKLTERFADLDGWWRQRFGYGLEGLTHAEARHLLRSPSADALRNRLAQARQEAGPGADAGAAREGGGGKRAGEPGVNDVRLNRLRERTRLDLELSLRGYFADEVSFGHIETDERPRRTMLQGTRPGTPVGEALRFIMQFKGFPIAFGQRVIGRAVAEPAGASAGARMLNGTVHAAHLIVGLTIAGYLAKTAKDAARGYAPRIPETPEQAMKVLAASIVQGGGLGIYGDFLFGEANRFGGSALGTLAGPAIGEAANLVDIWNRAREGDMKAADAFNWSLRNTPYLNLFYVRPALDYLVLQGLHESMSPGYLDRQAARRRKEYGQERLWEPMQ